MPDDTSPPGAGGLGPDVAARVLRAADRNTVAKVVAGAPLPASARARLETEALTAPTAEELSQLKSTRQASLIRKWGSGGKLSREEMAEIHTILPPSILASPPIIDGAGPALRVKYAKPYSAYALQIGVSERTLKRWSAHGKEMGDLFPFDALPLALDWWGRHMKNTPPAELVAAVSAAKKALPSTATTASALAAGRPRVAAAPAEAGKPEDAPKAPLMSRADMVADTLEEDLQRSRVIHSSNLRLLESAFLGSNEADIINRQRNAQRSREMLNSAQKAFDEYQRTTGNVVAIADVKADLVRIHTAMAQSLVGVLQDIGVAHPVAERAANAWFLMLRESAFFADTQPVLARPDPPATPVSTAP